VFRGREKNWAGKKSACYCTKKRGGRGNHQQLHWRINKIQKIFLSNLSLSEKGKVKNKKKKGPREGHGGQKKSCLKNLFEKGEKIRDAVQVWGKKNQRAEEKKNARFTAKEGLEKKKKPGSKIMPCVLMGLDCSVKKEKRV